MSDEADFDAGEPLPPYHRMTSPTQPPDLSDARERAREARERAAKATPGPWYVEEVGDHRRDGTERDRIIPDVVRWRGYTNALNVGEDVPTAAFIASARSDVPTLWVDSLADEVERLRAEIAELSVKVDQSKAAIKHNRGLASRLREAVWDIDAHSTPLGSDEDGFVAGGYVVSVGAVHRALGIAGGTRKPCLLCKPSSHDCAADPSTPTNPTP